MEKNKFVFVLMFYHLVYNRKLMQFLFSLSFSYLVDWIECNPQLAEESLFASIGGQVVAVDKLNSNGN